MIHVESMDWMLIASSAVFFALCGLCAYAVNRPYPASSKPRL
jgi:hypothetical protein